MVTRPADTKTKTNPKLKKDGRSYHYLFVFKGSKLNRHMVGSPADICVLSAKANEQNIQHVIVNVPTAENAPAMPWGRQLGEETSKGSHRS